MQEGMARSFDQSPVVAFSERPRSRSRHWSGAKTCRTAYFRSFTISLVAPPPLKLWSSFVYDSARLYRRWCRYRRSECMRRDSQIRQARLRHAGWRGSIPALQALDSFEGLFAREGSEFEKAPGTR